MAGGVQDPTMTKMALAPCPPPESWYPDGEILGILQGIHLRIQPNFCFVSSLLGGPAAPRTARRDTLITLRPWDLFDLQVR